MDAKDSNSHILEGGKWHHNKATEDDYITQGCGNRSLKPSLLVISVPQHSCLILDTMLVEELVFLINLVRFLN